MTHIITFYSFKGGVGRTMALVNTAHALAQQGARVLMVDFDLEAPGMTHFFVKTVRRRHKSGAKDALDLLLDAKRSYPEDATGRNGLAAPLSLDDYTIRLELPKAAESSLPYLNGRVDLLPATLESPSSDDAVDGNPSPDYLDRLAALDLPGIFGWNGPGHLFGKHIADYFRNARFKAPGDFVFSLRDPVQGAYDFVLVDSRTGLNEFSGLCIGPLCDSLVICTGLNEQNLAGTRYFLERIGLLEPAKGKPFLVVVGPVPPWRDKESDARIANIELVLTAREVFAVPYHPAAALAERVFVLESPAEPIGHSFRAIAARIMKDQLEALRPKIAETLLRASARHDPRAPAEDWNGLGMIPGACRLMGGSYSQGKDLVPAPFPTLLESILLLQTGSVVNLLWGGGEPLIMAVAVALYRRLSAALTKQVKLRLDGVDVKDEEREHLLVSIAFFFSRLHGKRGRDLLARHLSAEDKRTLAEVMSGESAKAAGLAGLALRHINGAKWDLREFETIARSWRPIRESPFEFESFERISRADLWTANYCDLELGSLARMQEFGVAIKKNLGRRDSRMEVREQLIYAYHGAAPPGFSLILTAGSIIASIEGPAGIESVMKCIEVGRAIHGYGWRVMINWKRLQRVHDCPEFKEFLAAEDAAIEDVERQFDQGVWPQ